MSFSYRRPLSPPRSLRWPTPTLRLLPGPPSSEHPNRPPPTPLSLLLLVRHRHPSPFHQTQPHLSVCPRQLQAGSGLRAPCHRSATPWMKCTPPAHCPNLRTNPPVWRKRKEGRTIRKLARPLPRWVWKQNLQDKLCLGYCQMQKFWI